MTIAAARPFGPEPTITASGLATGLLQLRLGTRMADSVSTYWYSRFLFERALALSYLVAFLVAAHQFVPLLGEHGLEPVPRFISFVPFRASPSLFFAFPNDRAFTIAAWAGVALSVLAFTSLPAHAGSLPNALVWIALWALYLS